MVLPFLHPPLTACHLSPPPCPLQVREELEQLLDDDDDMRALYLTRLATRIPDSPGGTITSRTTRGMRSVSQGAGGPHSLELNMSEWGGHDVQDLEMLLEAYFMQADGALNKLTTVRGGMGG